MSIEQLYSIYLNNPEISTDTRNILPSSIFFALRGDNFNGNKFAQQAIEKGASYVVIDEREYYIKGKTILVDNVLETLQELAKYHRSKFKIPVIGITGSNGKTTTKELINSVLNTRYKTFATKGNLNNHIGVPLSLLEVNGSHEIAIIEMGANHVGEIEFLCEISNPDYGLITNIGKAHLEGFGSFENVVKAKTELYASISNKKGKLFVNKDNPILMQNSKSIERLTYGKDKSNYINATLIEGPNLSLEFDSLTIKTQLVGSYNFENALAAIALGHYFGVDSANIKEALENYTPNNNRSQLIRTAKNTVIMDAYNANPVSMEVALVSLEKNIGDKIAILGDMRELGEYSLAEHTSITESLESKGLKAYLVGEEFSKVQSKFTTFKSVEELQLHLDQNQIVSNTILIKGSRGIKLETILNCL